MKCPEQANLQTRSQGLGEGNGRDAHGQRVPFAGDENALNLDRADGRTTL